MPNETRFHVVGKDENGKNIIAVFDKLSDLTTVASATTQAVVGLGSGLLAIVASDSVSIPSTAVASRKKEIARFSLVVESNDANEKNRRELFNGNFVVPYQIKKDRNLNQVYGTARQNLTDRKTINFYKSLFGIERDTTGINESHSGNVHKQFYNLILLDKFFDREGKFFGFDWLVAEFEESRNRRRKTKIVFKGENPNSEEFAINEHGNLFYKKNSAEASWQRVPADKIFAAEEAFFEARKKLYLELAKQESTEAKSVKDNLAKLIDVRFLGSIGVHLDFLRDVADESIFKAATLGGKPVNFDHYKCQKEADGSYILIEAEKEAEGFRLKFVDGKLRNLEKVVKKTLPGFTGFKKVPRKDEDLRKFIELIEDGEKKYSNYVKKSRKDILDDVKEIIDRDKSPEKQDVLKALKLEIRKIIVPENSTASQDIESAKAKTKIIINNFFNLSKSFIDNEGQIHFYSDPNLKLDNANQEKEIKKALRKFVKNYPEIFARNNYDDSIALNEASEQHLKSLSFKAFDLQDPEISRDYIRKVDAIAENSQDPILQHYSAILKERGLSQTSKDSHKLLKSAADLGYPKAIDDLKSFEKNKKNKTNTSNTTNSSRVASNKKFSDSDLEFAAKTGKEIFYQGSFYKIVENKKESQSLLAKTYSLYKVNQEGKIDRTADRYEISNGSITKKIKSAFLQRNLGVTLFGEKEEHYQGEFAENIVEFYQTENKKTNFETTSAADILKSLDYSISKDGVKFATYFERIVNGEKRIYSISKIAAKTKTNSSSIEAESELGSEVESELGSEVESELGSESGSESVKSQSKEYLIEEKREENGKIFSKIFKIVFDDQDLPKLKIFDQTEGSWKDNGDSALFNEVTSLLSWIDAENSIIAENKDKKKISNFNSVLKEVDRSPEDIYYHNIFVAMPFDVEISVKNGEECIYFLKTKPTGNFGEESYNPSRLHYYKLTADNLIYDLTEIEETQDFEPIKVYVKSLEEKYLFGEKADNIKERRLNYLTADLSFENKNRVRGIEAKRTFEIRGEKYKLKKVNIEGSEVDRWHKIQVESKAATFSSSEIKEESQEVSSLELIKLTRDIRQRNIRKEIEQELKQTKIYLRNQIILDIKKAYPDKNIKDQEKEAERIIDNFLGVSQIKQKEDGSFDYQLNDNDLIPEIKAKLENFQEFLLQEYLTSKEKNQKYPVLKSGFLGVFFENIKKDKQNAAYFYDQAAIEGNQYAQNNFARFLEGELKLLLATNERSKERETEIEEEKKDHLKANIFKFYRLAASQGNADAIQNLLRCYKEGIVIPKNEEVIRNLEFLINGTKADSLDKKGQLYGNYKYKILPYDPENGFVIEDSAKKQIAAIRIETLEADLRNPEFINFKKTIEGPDSKSLVAKALKERRYDDVKNEVKNQLSQVSKRENKDKFTKEFIDYFFNEKNKEDDKVAYETKIDLFASLTSEEKEVLKDFAKENVAELEKTDSLKFKILAGQIYYQGIGVEKDQKKATEIFKELAQEKTNLRTEKTTYEAKGEEAAFAQYQLGLIYLSGIEQDASFKNFNKAFKCFEAASNQGFILAKVAYANCLKNGIGCKKDLEEAKKIITEEIKRWEKDGGGVSAQLIKQYPNFAPYLVEDGFLNSESQKLVYSDAAVQNPKYYTNLGKAFAKEGKIAKTKNSDQNKIQSAEQSYQKGLESGVSSSIAELGKLYIEGKASIKNEAYGRELSDIADIFLNCETLISLENSKITVATPTTLLPNKKTSYQVSKTKDGYIFSIDGKEQDGFRINSKGRLYLIKNNVEKLHNLGIGYQDEFFMKVVEDMKRQNSFQSLEKNSGITPEIFSDLTKRLQNKFPPNEAKKIAEDFLGISKIAFGSEISINANKKYCKHYYGNELINSDKIPPKAVSEILKKFIADKKSEFEKSENPHIQNFLGICYEMGYMPEAKGESLVNSKKAEECYEKAAKKGFIPAEYNLARRKNYISEDLLETAAKNYFPAIEELVKRISKKEPAIQPQADLFKNLAWMHQNGYSEVIIDEGTKGKKTYLLEHEEMGKFILKEKNQRGGEVFQVSLNDSKKVKDNKYFTVLKGGTEISDISKEPDLEKISKKIGGTINKKDKEITDSISKARDPSSSVKPKSASKFLGMVGTAIDNAVFAYIAGF